MQSRPSPCAAAPLTFSSAGSKWTFVGAQKRLRFQVQSRPAVTLLHDNPGLTSLPGPGMVPGVPRQPRGDSGEWDLVLAHRPDDVRDPVSTRFLESGLAPARVQEVLEDGGDALCAAAKSGAKDWAEPFGGMLAAALLATEVSALAAHLNSRASAVRALAVSELLDHFSAVTVAERLGVSRQKVYEVSRGELTTTHINRVPWRKP